MDPLRVELRTFADKTRLCPVYSGASLSFEQPGRYPRGTEVEIRPFGAAHDFTFLPDSRLVLELDLLEPRESWQLIDPFPDWPTANGWAALALSEETAWADGDDVSDVPLVVKTDPSQSQVIVDLDYTPGTGDAYCLSETALVIVDGDRLVALFGRLG
jgi:hypothetical protein